MSINKDTVKAKMMKSIDVLKDELKKIRTGRANPDMIADVKVEAYGTMTPLNQVSNINVPDARSITIQPWDKSIIEDIAKAIQEADLGFNPSVDGEIVRISVPSLTEETRQEYVKLMKNKLEECRISLRNIRGDEIKDLDKGKTAGDLNEDEVKRSREILDEVIGEMNKW